MKPVPNNGREEFSNGPRGWHHAGPSRCWNSGRFRGQLSRVQTSPRERFVRELGIAEELLEIGPFAEGRTVAKGREVTVPSEEGPTQVPDGAIGVAPRLALSLGPSPIATPSRELCKASVGPGNVVEVVRARCFESVEARRSCEELAFCLLLAFQVEIPVAQAPRRGRSPPYSAVPQLPRVFSESCAASRRARSELWDGLGLTVQRLEQSPPIRR